MSFDKEKALRLVTAFMAALTAEEASAGEACCAASMVFRTAMENAPSPEEAADIRATCLQVLSAPGVVS